MTVKERRQYKDDLRTLYRIGAIEMDGNASATVWQWLKADPARVKAWQGKAIAGGWSAHRLGQALADELICDADYERPIGKQTLQQACLSWVVQEADWHWVARQVICHQS